MDLGTGVQMDWYTIEQKNREELALLLRNYLVGSPDHVTMYPVHTPGWYGRVAAMRFQAGELYIDGHWLTMLRQMPPLSQLSECNAFVNLQQRIGPRVPSDWRGLTPLGERFIQLRCEQYRATIDKLEPSELLTHTFMTTALPINTEQFDGHSESMLQLQALTAPDPGLWRTRLTGTIDQTFCYVVSDQAMRYNEELARMRMYSLAQREHDLDRAEHEFKFVLNILRDELPHAYERLRRVMEVWVNRTYYSIVDDYAAATEQLCHIVTMRRQGFLGAGQLDIPVARKVLGTSLIDQRRILPDP